MNRVVPRQRAPELQVQTTAGESWRLSDQRPPKFTMIVFYRGLHCPICKSYIKELDSKRDEFVKRGVEVIVASSDSRDRAEQAERDWGLTSLKIGYGLSLASAREWGLYVSRAIKESEPSEFAEPGIFLVKPDGTLYWATTSSMPFARPSFEGILAGISFVTANNYPARGEA